MADEQKLAKVRDALAPLSLHQLAELAEWAQGQDLVAEARLVLLQEVMFRDNG